MRLAIKHFLPSDNELLAVDSRLWIVPTNPAAAGVSADIRWKGAKKVTSGPEEFPLPFPPPNLVSHSPVRSGTVSFSASLPSDVGAASSRTFSADAVDVIKIGTIIGGGFERVVFVWIVIVVLDDDEGGGSESVGESLLLTTIPPGRLSVLLAPFESSFPPCFFLNLLLSLFFFFLFPFPVLNPLAWSSWNRDFALSVSTIRCCWLGTEDLRMASFCRSASL